jgi:hypothetical protein
MIAWTPEEVEKLLQHITTLPTDEKLQAKLSHKRTKERI